MEEVRGARTDGESGGKDRGVACCQIGTISEALRDLPSLSSSSAMGSARHRWWRIQRTPISTAAREMGRKLTTCVAAALRRRATRCTCDRWQGQEWRAPPRRLRPHWEHPEMRSNRRWPRGPVQRHRHLGLRRGRCVAATPPRGMPSRRLWSSRPSRAGAAALRAGQDPCVDCGSDWIGRVGLIVWFSFVTCEWILVACFTFVTCEVTKG